MSDEVVVRAGLWPRAVALFIDGCLITLVLGLLGLVLFVPTGGRIRVNDVLVGSQTCTRQNQQVLQDLGITLPSDFRLTQIVRCTKALLGHVYDRVLIVVEASRAGAATTTRELKFPLDTEGRPTHPFYLDSLSTLVFAVYTTFLEWRAGRTLGKDLMDIRVQSLVESRLGPIGVLKRFLYRFFPVILLEMLSLISKAAIVVIPGSIYWFVSIVTLASMLAITINFFIAVRRGRLPWHDDFAGTEVVVGR